MEATIQTPILARPVERDVGRVEPERNPILAAIERLRLSDSKPVLAGTCGHCRRGVCLGGAFFHGGGVYCATDGCVLAALDRHKSPALANGGAQRVSFVFEPGSAGRLEGERQ